MSGRAESPLSMLQAAAAQSRDGSDPEAISDRKRYLDAFWVISNSFHHLSMSERRTALEVMEGTMHQLDAFSFFWVLRLLKNVIPFTVAECWPQTLALIKAIQRAPHRENTRGEFADLLCIVCSVSDEEAGREALLDGLLACLPQGSRGGAYELCDAILTCSAQVPAWREKGGRLLRRLGSEAAERADDPVTRHLFRTIERLAQSLDGTTGQS